MLWHEPQPITHCDHHQIKPDAGAAHHVPGLETTARCARRRPLHTDQESQPMRPLLLLLPAILPAMESFGAVDFHQQDKQKHAVAGAILATCSELVSHGARPDLKWWQHDLIALGVSTVAGIAKEVHDDHAGRKHDTADWRDAEATAIGGGAVIAFSHTFRF